MKISENIYFVLSLDSRGFKSSNTNKDKVILDTDEVTESPTNVKLCSSRVTDMSGCLWH